MRISTHNNYKYSVLFLFFCFFMMINLNFNLNAEDFRFQFEKGNTSRILSTVQEDVFFNGRFNHRAEIVNRISVEVTDTMQSDDGVSGVIHAVFMTSENSTGASDHQYTWGEEYTSDFTRSSLGKYSIDDNFYMPVVRDVPIFLGKDVKIGQSWTAEGHEAHDLRQTFGIEKPFKVPFSAKYTYTGTVEGETGLLHVISAQYSLYYDSPIPKNTDYSDYSDYPATTMGFSNQTIYWDNEKGCIDHYTETFRIVIESAFGNTYEFRGSAGAEVTDYTSHSGSQSLDRVRQQIQDLGIENTNVTAADNGITISIENIQFLPDSAILTDTEKRKLDEIVKILSAFPDNDLLISGHTALAGTEKVRQSLSEERAASVASYLLQSGVKDAYHIFTRGFGASVPIADNTTEEGKSRNRRVEITILDE